MDVLAAQISTLSSAILALFSSHPDHPALRARFEYLHAQLQISQARSGASPEALAMTRLMAQQFLAELD